jgi:sugar (pentulose or hexulose) kinase
VGAAIQGGIAAGVVKDFEEAKKFAPVFAEVTEPHQDRAEHYEDAFARYKRIYPSLRDWFA